MDWGEGGERMPRRLKLRQRAGEKDSQVRNLLTPYSLPTHLIRVVGPTGAPRSFKLRPPPRQELSVRTWASLAHHGKARGRARVCAKGREC
jgi:hypothetical protein